MKVGITGDPSPFKMYLQQSEIYLDKLVKEFIIVIKAGGTPNDYIDEVFEKVGCRQSDLSDLDVKRLERRVEAAYRSYHR